MNQLLIDFKNNPIIKEYSLRIVPSSEVYHEVLALKEEFRTTFGPAMYLNSEPHVTIAWAVLDVERESKLIQELKTILKGVSNFSLRANDIMKFIRSNSLVISVEKEDVLNTLFKPLTDLLKDEL